MDHQLVALRKKRRARPMFSVVLALLSVGFVTTTWAQDITASLSQETDNQVMLRVSVRDHGAISLIAQLFLPPSYRVQATEPAAAKIDAREGVVKWLVKHEHEGTITLRAYTNKPLDLSSVRGLVRYRRTSDGSIADIWAEQQ